MDGIQGFVVEQLVQSGIDILLKMTNPVGGVIKILETVYDFIMFIRDNWERIFKFAQTVYDTVADIAAGNIAGAAALLENALGQTIPMILDFLAKLLNFDGIVDKIQEILNKVRAPINQGIDKVLEMIIQAARSVLKSVGLEGKEDESDDSLVTDEERKKHEKLAPKIAQELRETGKDKEFKTFEDFYNYKKEQAKILEDRYKSEVGQGIEIHIKFKDIKKDAKDSDIDVKVVIAPNATTEDFELVYNAKDKNYEKTLASLIAQGNKSGDDLDKFKLRLDQDPSAKSFLKAEKDGDKLNIYAIYEDNKLIATIEFKLPYEVIDEGKTNPVYKHVNKGGEYVQDKMGQYIPRIMWRFINDHDVETLKKSGEVKPSAKTIGASEAKKELNHVAGTKPSWYLSITREGNRHILNPKGERFNNYGRIEIDLAEIAKENISDMTTKRGIKGYLIKEMQDRKDKKITSSDVQAIMDVVRTLEVLVFGSIPESAIIDYMKKREFDELVDGDTREEPENIAGLKEEYDRKLENRQKVDPEEVLDTTWNSYYPSK